MKELTINEMNLVSGAYNWNNAGAFMSNLFANTVEFFGSAALGAAAGGAAGAVIGGAHGGDGGGIIGAGTIGQGVGMIVAGGIGAICGGVAGALVGWDATTKYVAGAFDAAYKGDLVLW